MSFRLSVGARLMLAFLGVTVVFTAALTVSIARLAAFHSAVTDIAGPKFTQVQMADAWAANVSESMSHMRNMLIEDDKSKIQGETARVRALAEQRAAHMAALSAVAHSAESKAALNMVSDAAASLTPFDEEYLRQIETGDLKAAKETLLRRALPAQLSLIFALQKLSDMQAAGVRERAEQNRISYRNARLLLFTLWLGTVAVAVVMASLLARLITRPLNQAVTVLAAIKTGNYMNTVTVNSSDAIGQTLQGLADLQIALRERTDKERASAADNARIRSALDRVSVGAMLGDLDGKIIYVNDAMVCILRQLDFDIRRAIPSFDPDAVLGGSFDVFQQISLLQQHRLAALTTIHSEDVKFGRASLRIVASPIDSAGQRVGTVVQWFDRTQEVAAEEEVRAVVVKAIDGNLTARVHEAGDEGVFKALANGINRLLDNMSDVVRNMARAAAEVRTGADEISRGNANLSQRTEEQAASLEQTAASMEEMTSTVINNADNAAQANQLASAAREQAERGGAVVSSAVVAMSEINASSRKIADIIGVIDEIAFQTNLLALNAAVEAARAGDKGRGFAVVASEVRNLASRSAQAAKEIKALIRDSVEKVTEGTKLVDDSGKALGEIVSRVKKVTDMMAEIARSSREQASGIEQVNKAITSMDYVTQQNAALVEQAAAAAQALTQQAATLTQLITRYSVGDDSPRNASHAIARSAIPAAAAVPLVERRSPNRPLSGKKTPVANPASVAQALTAAVGAGEDWNDF